jgi:nitrogen fixation NifU-like protein
MTDLYHEALLDAARHPKNSGDPTKDGGSVVVEEFNASCGDRVTLSVRLVRDATAPHDPQKTSIKAVVWSGTGCIISQASLSELSEQVLHKTVAEALLLTKVDLENALGIEHGISPGRIKCLTLGLHALHRALNQEMLIGAETARK